MVWSLNKQRDAFFMAYDLFYVMDDEKKDLFP
jgi:hypothetical protein